MWDVLCSHFNLCVGISAFINVILKGISFGSIPILLTDVLRSTLKNLDPLVLSKIQSKQRTVGVPSISNNLKVLD